jgi:hypothetical protein
MHIKPTLRIKAKSIVLHPAAYGTVITLTLFEPEEETMFKLNAAKPGDMYQSIEIVDTRDDGAEDIHESMRIHTLLKLHAAEPHKSHTQVVTFTTS